MESELRRMAAKALRFPVYAPSRAAYGPRRAHRAAAPTARGWGLGGRSAGGPQPTQLQPTLGGATGVALHRRAVAPHEPHAHGGPRPRGPRSRLRAPVGSGFSRIEGRRRRPRPRLGRCPRSPLRWPRGRRRRRPLALPGPLRRPTSKPSRRLARLPDLLDTLATGPPSLIYITPIDIEAIEARLDPADVAAVHENLDRLRATLEAGPVAWLDLSTAPGERRLRSPRAGSPRASAPERENRGAQGACCRR